MKEAEIIPIAVRTGKNEADITNLQKDAENDRSRIEKLEDYQTLQKLAIAKCTALWGFILVIATTIGGFVAYNFVKVKDAIVAAFQAFYSGN